MTTLLILAAVTVAVTAAVLTLLWWRDWQIDHIGDCFDFEPTDDDAPRDDNNWQDWTVNDFAAPDDVDFEAWLRKKYGLNDPTP